MEKRLGFWISYFYTWIMGYLTTVQHMKHITIPLMLIVLLSACIQSPQRKKGRSSSLSDTRDTNALDAKRDSFSVVKKSKDLWLPAMSSVKNPEYSTQLLFKSWKHDSSDKKPAFSIDKDYFSIHYGDTISQVPYILQGNRVEVFEYHDGETARGEISKLTEDSLHIHWSTGDINKYTTQTNE